MGSSKRPITGVTLIFALIIFGCWLGVRHKSRSVQPPPGTPFVTDTSQVTYDKELARLLVRANDAIKNGDLNLAEDLYRQAVSKWPNDADRHTNLGVCLGLQKNYDAAEAEFALALQLNPQSVAALYNMGCNAYAQRRHDDAKMYLERASAIDAKHAGCHRALGMVHEASGNKTEAIAHYERAIKLAPSIYVNENELRQYIDKLKE